MRFHLTRKLAAKVKLGTLDAAPNLSSDGLDSWYANMFRVQRRQLIIFVNEASMLAIICYGSGVTNSRILVDTFHAALISYLQPAGLLRPYMLSIGQTASTEAGFHKTASRRVLGVINDFSWRCEFFLEHYHGDYLRFCMDELNYMPVGKLEQTFPGNQFIELVELRLISLGLHSQASREQRLCEIERIKLAHLKAWQEHSIYFPGSNWQFRFRLDGETGGPLFQDMDCPGTGNDHSGNGKAGNGDGGIIEFRKPGN